MRFLLAALLFAISYAQTDVQQEGVTQSEETNGIAGVSVGSTPEEPAVEDSGVVVTEFETSGDGVVGAETSPGETSNATGPETQSNTESVSGETGDGTGAETVAGDTGLPPELDFQSNGEAVSGETGAGSEIGAGPQEGQGGVPGPNTVPPLPPRCEDKPLNQCNGVARKQGYICMPSFEEGKATCREVRPNDREAICESFNNRMSCSQAGCCWAEGGCSNELEDCRKQPRFAPPTSQGQGFQPSGFQPSGFQPSASQPSGFQPAASQPSGFQPAASQPSGFQPVPSLPSGFQPVPSLPSGFQPVPSLPEGSEPAVARCEDFTTPQSCGQTTTGEACLWTVGTGCRSLASVENQMTPASNPPASTSGSSVPSSQSASGSGSSVPSSQANMNRNTFGLMCTQYTRSACEAHPSCVFTGQFCVSLFEYFEEMPELKEICKSHSPSLCMRASNCHWTGSECESIAEFQMEEMCEEYSYRYCGMIRGCMWAGDKCVFTGISSNVPSAPEAPVDTPISSEPEAQSNTETVGGDAGSEPQNASGETEISFQPEIPEMTSGETNGDIGFSNNESVPSEPSAPVVPSETSNPGASSATMAPYVMDCEALPFDQCTGRMEGPTKVCIFDLYERSCKSANSNSPADFCVQYDRNSCASHSQCCVDREDGNCSKYDPEDCGIYNYPGLAGYNRLSQTRVNACSQLDSLHKCSRQRTHSGATCVWHAATKMCREGSLSSVHNICGSYTHEHLCQSNMQCNWSSEGRCIASLKLRNAKLVIDCTAMQSRVSCTGETTTGGICMWNSFTDSCFEGSNTAEHSCLQWNIEIECINHTECSWDGTCIGATSEPTATEPANAPEKPEAASMETTTTEAAVDVQPTNSGGSQSNSGGSPSNSGSGNSPSNSGSSPSNSGGFPSNSGGFSSNSGDLSPNAGGLPPRFYGGKCQYNPTKESCIGSYDPEDYKKPCFWNACQQRCFDGEAGDPEDICPMFGTHQECTANVFCSFVMGCCVKREQQMYAPASHFHHPGSPFSAPNSPSGPFLPSGRSPSDPFSSSNSLDPFGPSGSSGSYNPNSGPSPFGGSFPPPGFPPMGGFGEFEAPEAPEFGDFPMPHGGGMPGFMPIGMDVNCEQLLQAQCVGQPKEGKGTEICVWLPAKNRQFGKCKSCRRTDPKCMCQRYGDRASCRKDHFCGWDHRDNFCRDRINAAKSNAELLPPGGPYGPGSPRGSEGFPGPGPSQGSEGFPRPGSSQGSEGFPPQSGSSFGTQSGPTSFDQAPTNSFDSSPGASPGVVDPLAGGIGVAATLQRASCGQHKHRVACEQHDICQWADGNSKWPPLCIYSGVLRSPHKDSSSSQKTFTFTLVLISLLSAAASFGVVVTYFGKSRPTNEELKGELLS